MIHISDREPRSAFSIWLRTGRLPRISTTDGIEHKFNPWHDPLDGRFTFVGSGRHYGPGGAGLSSRANARNPGSIDRQKPRQPRIAVRPSTVASPPCKRGSPAGTRLLPRRSSHRRSPPSRDVTIRQIQSPSLSWVPLKGDMG